METNKISLALTTYNRTDLLWESFRQVVNDPRIAEIVIVDDCSPMEVYNTIAWQTKSIDKVKLFRNEKNLDCYRNKAEAISRASNEWVIIFDSDNILTTSYLDAVFAHSWNKHQIFQPCFARPHFNFLPFQNKIISASNVSRYMHDDTFKTMLNAMNYFVNREEYLRVWDGGIDPVTSDSLYQNYRWLSLGNSMYIVPGMEYEHRVHNGSHYQQNVKRTPRGLHDSILIKLKNLK